jgi:hypothetical protein
MVCSSVSKGESAKFLVALKAYEKGFSVSFPTTESSRYDAIIDTGKKLFRVQIKYTNAKSSKNLVRLILYRPHLKAKPYLRADIDFLLVYIPDLDKILCFNWKKFHNKKYVYVNLKDPKSKHYYAKFVW